MKRNKEVLTKIDVLVSPEIIKKDFISLCSLIYKVEAALDEHPAFFYKDSLHAIGNYAGYLSCCAEAYFKATNQL